jgi:dTDP-4-amino-4,6-dideoxygalactose transaminase
MENLALHGGPQAVGLPKPHYTWPVITDRTRAAVLAQLDTAVTIYDKSGVIDRFERQFAAYHDRRNALLNCSGTMALLAAYFGLDLQPGDEVLCPVYTFFATVSPLAILGVRPIFCDCDANGNLDPRELEKRVTAKTKAVIVTHMWGIPCDMDPIAQFCAERNLSLVEDCSHAHGARYKGRLMGTFGNVAVWSLQGQKMVTGGEGGILLTDDDEIYRRAVLLGHYNVRSKQALPMDHALRRFCLTGGGLKLRAHPIAVAMAEEQFTHLDEWVEQKQEFYQLFRDGLAGIDWLRFPDLCCRQPSWNALILQFDEENAGGVPLARVVAALRAEGMAEVDQPVATCLMHDLPLFTDPGPVFPMTAGLGGNDAPNTGYPTAERFFRCALKVPVWAFKENRPIVEAYIEGFQKVDFWMRRGALDREEDSPAANPLGTGV